MVDLVLMTVVKEIKDLIVQKVVKKKVIDSDVSGVLEYVQ